MTSLAKQAEFSLFLHCLNRHGTFPGEGDWWSAMFRERLKVKRGREDQNNLDLLKITYSMEVFAQENVGFGCPLVVGRVHCPQFLLH